MIDNTDIPQGYSEENTNKIPLKKMPDEEYNIAADLSAKGSEAVDNLMPSEDALPKDHELLKAILGEDYATQSLSRNEADQQQDFNPAKLLNTESDETGIDEIISTILHEDDAPTESLYSEFTDNESTDIDAFLQKYLTEDDTDDDILQQQLPDDEPSEITHADHDKNIDELVLNILNKDITDLTLPDENNLIDSDRQQTDILPQITQSETSFRTQEKKSGLSSPAPKITDTRIAPTASDSRVVENTEKPKFTSINYQATGIALFLLIVTAILVWIFVIAPQDEPANTAEISPGHETERMKPSEPKKESKPDLHQAMPESSELSRSHTEAATQSEKAATVDKHLTINSSIIHLIEQQNKNDTDEQAEELFTLDTENLTHTTEIETAIYSTTDDAHNEVGDEVHQPLESNSEPDEIGDGDITLLQDSPTVDTEINIDESEIETTTLASTDETHNKYDSEINGTTDITTNLDAISDEHTQADDNMIIPAVSNNRKDFWALNLSSIHNQIIPATEELERIKSAGIPAEVKAVFVDRKKWYRIRVIGFTSFTEAKDFMAEVSDKTDIENYWISKETVDSE